MGPMFGDEFAVSRLDLGCGPFRLDLPHELSGLVKRDPRDQRPYTLDRIWIHTKLSCAQAN